MTKFMSGQKVLNMGLDISLLIQILNILSISERSLFANYWGVGGGGGGS